MYFFLIWLNFKTPAAISSHVLLGSSLTLLGTLQKKESNVTVNYGPGTMDIKFIQVLLLYEDTEPHSDSEKSDKYPSVEGRYNAYFSNHEAFIRKRFITHCTIFHIGTTKLLKFLNVSHLHIIKYY